MPMTREERRAYNQKYYYANHEHCLMLKVKSRIKAKEEKLLKLKSILDCLNELPFRFCFALD